MMNAPLTHGEIVKRLINDNKVSITDMSKKTGIKRTTIYSIINQNQKKIRPETYQKIADYFNVSADVFFKEPMSAITYYAYTPHKKDLASFGLKNLLDEYNRTYEFVYYALCLAGIKSYSLDDVKAMINGDDVSDNGYLLPHQLGEIISEIIIKGVLININELFFIRDFRNKKYEDQLLIKDIMDRLA
jgi:DNA-binding helix-turn-helix protein